MIEIDGEDVGKRDTEGLEEMDGKREVDGIFVGFSVIGVNTRLPI